MKQWFAGGANKITLGRIPCMFLVLYAVFYRGRDSVGWFWVGAVALVVGSLLDLLDGYYARRMKQESSEGQFLDQFVDKWGFIYPLLFAFSLVRLDTLWLGWHPLLIGMLVLDIRSCYKHYLNYRRAKLTGQFNSESGSISFGKAKFWVQVFVVCLVTASLCPPVEASSAMFFAATSNRIGWIGREGFIGSYVGLALAIVLALLSLSKRRNGPWPGWMRQVRTMSYMPL